MDNRFIEIACELAGVKSPADIRREELIKLLREHFGDAKAENYLETEAGVIYRAVFDEEYPED